MDYINAFWVGGLICVAAQILIDKTNMTPARILVLYVVIGTILGGIGIYDKLVDFAGARGKRASCWIWQCFGQRRYESG